MTVNILIATEYLITTALWISVEANKTGGNRRWAREFWSTPSSTTIRKHGTAPKLWRKFCLAKFFHLCRALFIHPDLNITLINTRMNGRKCRLKFHKPPLISKRTRWTISCRLRILFHVHNQLPISMIHTSRANSSFILRLMNTMMIHLWQQTTIKASILRFFPKINCSASNLKF